MDIRLSAPIAVLLVLASIATLPTVAPWDPEPAPLTGYVQGPIQESTTDADADGAIDAILLTVTVQANVSGFWYVWGFLNVNGTGAGNQTRIDLPVGPTSVTIDFQGWQIRRAQTDGPYAVSFQIYHADSGYSWRRDYATGPYAWTDFELHAEFIGGFLARGTDADSDGLFNYLEVSGTVNVGKAGRYQVYGELWDQAGSVWITSSSNMTNWSVGTGNFRIWFNGDAIRTRGINGPYNVTLRLTDEQWLIDYQRRWFLTGAFTASQFAHAPVSFGGPPSDAAVDVDANGIPDVLRVTVPVVVAIPGTYRASGLLQVDPITTVYAQGEATLPAGPGNMIFDFDGWEIRNRYANGPYPATLSVWELKSGYGIQTTHTTAAYSWWMWDNPYGNIRTPFEIIPRDTDGDGGYNEVEVRAIVDMKVAGDFGLYFSLNMGGDTIDGAGVFSGGPGPVSVSHTFAGWWIRSYQWNGTYRFSIVLAGATGATDNRTFTWDQFDPAIRLTGSPGFTPVDTDGDGEYNQLIATFPLYIETGGTYSFSLSARDGIGNYTGTGTDRSLTEGPLDLVLRLSGFSLRWFQGDALLDFRISTRVDLWRTVYVLGWTGTYGIPDPTAFEFATMVTVTFNLVAPEPLLCCSTVILASYPDAYFPWLSGGPGTVTATVPDVDYAFVATGTGAAAPNSNYVGFGTILAPLPSTVTVDMGLLTYAETATIAFEPWSSGSAWTNRTLSVGASFRFFADIRGEPDGMATEAEMLGLVLPYTMWAPIDAQLDGTPVAETVSGDYTMGAGPALDAAPAGYGRSWHLTVAVSSGASHRITVRVPWWWTGTSSYLAVRVPLGWAVAVGDAPAEIEATMVTPREIRLRPTSVGSYTVYTVNLTATATATPAVIMGRVVDDTSMPVQGAAIILSLGATEVASGTTGTDGRFLFSGLSAGTYTVLVRATGFADATRTVDLVADEFADLGDIALERSSPSGSVRGRVVDSEGNGIAGARVSMSNASGEVAATITAADGAFTVTGVLAGTYTLRVTATGFLDRELPVTIPEGEVDVGTIPLTRAGTNPPPLDYGLVAAAGVGSAIAIAAAIGILLWRRRSKGKPE